MYKNCAITFNLHDKLFHSKFATSFQQCVNTVSRKCEYGVLEITKTSDLTRLLYHAWFPKPHTHISALTALALLKTTNKRYETTNVMRYLSERNESDETIFKHFGQCTHMCQVKVNVLTCDYIDFYKLLILQDKIKLVKLMLDKSQCTHMWLHWLLFGTCDYIDRII